MSDPTSSNYDPNAPVAASPAGWYPDAQGVQRWWDGQAWTDHVAAPAMQPTVLGYEERPQLPEGTRTDTGWIWLAALATFVSAIPMFFLDTSAIADAAMVSSGGMVDPFLGMGGMIAVSWGLGLLTWGATVLGAYFDYKHLLSVGAVRPFHWAFAFIPYPLVYLIGRHVVLRKMVRTSGAPLWTHVAAYVLLFIGSMIWAIAITAQLVSEMSNRFS